MRFRDVNSVQDIQLAATAVANLVGQRKYRDILEQRMSKAGEKGYIAPFEKLVLSLTEELRRIEQERRKKSISLRTASRYSEGVNLILGLGQAIPYLSDTAQKKLAHIIESSINDDKIRALNHEFRVAERISTVGWDVCFSDLEAPDNNNGMRVPDLLARKGERAFEVEVKNISTHSGFPVNPQDQDKLWDIIRSGFHGWDDEKTIPIVNIVIDGNLSPNRDYQIKILSALNQVCSQKEENEITIQNNTSIKYVGKVTYTSDQQIKMIANKDSSDNLASVIMKFVHPRVIVRITSKKNPQIFRTITKKISEAAKQCSGVLPGIIWCHFEYIDHKDFQELCNNEIFFKGISDRAFKSEKRKHICQIVFSGGSIPVFDMKLGKPVTRCSYFHKVFNSTHDKFGGLYLF